MESAGIQEAATCVGNEQGHEGVANEVYVYPGGASYRGDWKDRQRHGRGVYTKPNGETYEGRWLENNMHGRGVFTWAAGVKYEGEFDKGLLHGQGRYDYAPGQYYIGEWREDKKHGKGKMVFPDGDEYEGEWRFGERHGFGIYKQSKARVTYYGGYENSFRSGQGFLFENGHYYELKSSRQDGKPIGQLEISKKDFDEAVEALRNGQRWPSKLEEKLVGLAPGLQYRSYPFQSGATYEGTWKGSKRHGHGKWRHPEGDMYEGEYEDNKEHGWGVYTFATDRVKKFCGQWAGGQMHGYGVYLFSPDGKERFEGYYKEDRKHGKGLYTFPTGEMKFQTWHNGVLQEEHDPSKSDLDFIRELTTDAIERLDRVAPGHLAFLTTVAEQEQLAKVEEEQRKLAEAEAAKRQAAERVEAELAAEERKRKLEADRRAHDDAERQRREQRIADEAAKEQEAAAERARMKEEADRIHRAAVAAEEERRLEAARLREAAAADASANMSPPADCKIFPYSQLVLPQSTLTRTEIDFGRREMHLSNEEFERIFEMTKEKFRELPQWRGDALRKKHHLF